MIQQLPLWAAAAYPGQRWPHGDGCCHAARWWECQDILHGGMKMFKDSTLLLSVDGSCWHQDNMLILFGPILHLDFQCWERSHSSQLLWHGRSVGAAHSRLYMYHAYSCDQLWLTIFVSSAVDGFHYIIPNAYWAATVPQTSWNDCRGKIVNRCMAHGGSCLGCSVI